MGDETQGNKADESGSLLLAGPPRRKTRTESPVASRFFCPLPAASAKICAG